MSEPASTTAHPKPAASTAGKGEPPKPARRGRFRDTLSLLLLLAASGGVAAAAAPAVLRAAGLGGPEPDTSPHDAERLKLPQPPAGSPAHPIFAPDDEDDDEPRMTELERRYPDGMWPGRRTQEERDRDRELFPGLAAPDGGSHRTGLARRPLRLLEDPLPGASALAVIRAGEPVQVLKETGDWALVRYRGGEGAITGWVRKSEIAVR
jgi:Bacterial SH3 domain